MVIAAHGITVVLAVFVAAAIHFMVVAMVITADITEVANVVAPVNVVKVAYITVVSIHLTVVAMVITAYITVVSIHLMVVACKFSGADFSRLRPTEIGCRNSKWSHVRLMAVYTGS